MDSVYGQGTTFEFFIKDEKYKDSEIVKLDLGSLGKKEPTNIVKRLQRKSILLTNSGLG